MFPVSLEEGLGGDMPVRIVTIILSIMLVVGHCICSFLLLEDVSLKVVGEVIDICYNVIWSHFIAIFL